MPYVAQNACTFECCQYGPWRATSAAAAVASTIPGAKIVFAVKPGDTVRARRGIVITSKPGVTRVIKAVTLGYRDGGTAPELSLKPGDALLTLYPMGEAYDRFWYHGKFYDDEIDMPEDAFGNVSFTGFLKVESRPTFVWWVQVKNAQGVEGWLANPRGFDGMDSCA
ncbi:hypothetical protein [Luteibacter sp. OK325]|jgi:hypothetical protein|uniref:hypothetical protein n=1 Tax=Luteibacter sp. OK325 TaxID=2135670 RepID=UPI0011B2016F|nr:hypothetical protein [Luteibacter sp. OK325]